MYTKIKIKTAGGYPAKLICLRVKKAATRRRTPNHKPLWLPQRQLRLRQSLPQRRWSPKHHNLR